MPASVTPRDGLRPQVTAIPQETTRRYCEGVFPGLAPAVAAPALLSPSKRAVHRGHGGRQADRSGPGRSAASLAASMYWLTNTLALAYPGAKSVDPPGTATFPQWKFALPGAYMPGKGPNVGRNAGSRRSETTSLLGA